VVYFKNSKNINNLKHIFHKFTRLLCLLSVAVLIFMEIRLSRPISSLIVRKNLLKRGIKYSYFSFYFNSRCTKYYTVIKLFVIKLKRPKIKMWQVQYIYLKWLKFIVLWVVKYVITIIPFVYRYRYCQPTFRKERFYLLKNIKFDIRMKNIWFVTNYFWLVLSMDVFMLGGFRVENREKIVIAFFHTWCLFLIMELWNPPKNKF